MDIVFDQTFTVSGEEMPVKLPFSQTIFVMEDIDAASPIVQNRNKPKEKNKHTRLKVRREHTLN